MLPTGDGVVLVVNRAAGGVTTGLVDWLRAELPDATLVEAAKGTDRGPVSCWCTGSPVAEPPCALEPQTPRWQGDTLATLWPRAKPRPTGYENGPVLTSLRAVSSSVGPSPNDGHSRATPQAPQAGRRA
jgi:hypothetical protein